ncbi:DoxX family protein [Maribacter sp. 2-571]|uniref:DoxX family protein n=1 Tax=Maribacter sp. 2-571 TaxID=3417569 RepID=UPI003D340542
MELTLFYTALGIISLIYSIAGTQKLIGMEPMKSRMEEMNNGGVVMRMIGVLEITGVIGLWFSSIRPFALIGLLPFAVGGLAAHIVLKHNFMERNIPAVLMIILIIAALFLDSSFSITFH